jgi:hypothetical protein
MKIIPESFDFYQTPTVQQPSMAMSKTLMGYFIERCINNAMI